MPPPATQGSQVIIGSEPLAVIPFTQAVEKSSKPPVAPQAWKMLTMFTSRPASVWKVARSLVLELSGKKKLSK